MCDNLVLQDLSANIEQGHSSCLCPLCDNEVSTVDDFDIVQAHGSIYMVHTMCMEELE